MKCVKVDDEEEGGVIQIASFCKAQLQRDVIRDTTHSVAKHNGSSDPSLSLFFFLFSLGQLFFLPPWAMGHISTGV